MTSTLDRILQEFGFVGKHAEYLRHFAQTHTPVEVATLAPLLVAVRPQTIAMMMRDNAQANRKEKQAKKQR